MQVLLEPFHGVFVPVSQGKYFGIESHVLSPSEVKEVHPLLRIDDIYGGVYSPGDGTIDPTSVCNAYAKASRKFGGGVYENVGVTSIEVEDYLTAGSAPGRRIKALGAIALPEVPLPNRPGPYY